MKLLARALLFALLVGTFYRIGSHTTTVVLPDAMAIGIAITISIRVFWTSLRAQDGFRCPAIDHLSFRNHIYQDLVELGQVNFFRM